MKDGVTITSSMVHPDWDNYVVQLKADVKNADGKEVVGFWTAKNGTVEQWDSDTYMDGGKKCSSQDGLFTNYLFFNKDGVPLLECVEVATKTHAIWPSECFDAWDTWFSHFTKDNGTLYYDGKAVQ